PGSSVGRVGGDEVCEGSGCFLPCRLDTPLNQALLSGRKKSYGLRHTSLLEYKTTRQIKRGVDLLGDRGTSIRNRCGDRKRIWGVRAVHDRQGIRCRDVHREQGKSGARWTGEDKRLIR